MSGTSLDGLDIALCHFYHENDQPKFKLIAAETIAYEAFWKEQLQHIYNGSAQDYLKLNGLYGAFIGDQINQFLAKHKQTAHYIASHGHTIFHQPELGFSAQIGCGAAIAARTGISTICDFRSLDVALNGQGAPLVPIGDRDLFGDQAACLNLGGIANISFTKNNTTKAFDICVANMSLNYLTELIGKSYDDDGLMASKGTINSSLLQHLLSLTTDHKSLGREWFEQQFLPLLIASSISMEDKLATCVEYTVIKINQCLNDHHLNSVLITGGGAYNSFLIERLKYHYHGIIHIPDDVIIQFKEAIIFAYLGFLRIHQQVNALSSVTKASANSSGGAIYIGKQQTI